MASKQVKRKFSDSFAADPPKYSEVALPLSDANDDDLVLAAEALTKLTHSVSPPPTHDVSTNASTLGSPVSSTSLQDMDEQVHPIVLGVNAVTKHPIVTNAVRYYETSKRNYATFNYAAGIVEKAAIPVFSKIEVNLNNIHQARLKKRRYGPTEKVEVKRRLKFCLHILKLANDNISAKVLDLQRRIQEKETQPGEITPVNDDVPLKDEMSEALSELTAVSSTVPVQAQETRTEIIATVKKIIHVISNFRPSALNAEDPEEVGRPDDETKLKGTIREIILNLPNQFQQSGALCSQTQLTTSDRVIMFARESLDMIGRLTSVFNEQLEKAETWVGGETESEVQVHS